MSGILDLLSSQLGDKEVDQISQQLGTSKEQTQSAISAALPTLLGAISKKAESEQGAAELHQEVERDHDGSLLDSLSGFLGDGQAESTGNSLLGSILGSKQERVNNAIGSSSGLDASKAGSLMSMLAPMVMGAIGKRQRSEGLSSSGLSSMLRGERESIEKSEGGSFIGRLLDQDGDGDFDMADIMKLGMSKLFGR